MAPAHQAGAGPTAGEPLEVPVSSPGPAAGIVGFDRTDPSPTERAGPRERAGRDGTMLGRTAEERPAVRRVRMGGRSFVFETSR